MKLLRTTNNLMKLPRSQKDLTRKYPSTEYWELNNQMELIVVRYDPEDVVEYKDRCEIGVRISDKDVTQEVFDKFEKYKDILNLDDHKGQSVITSKASWENMQEMTEKMFNQLIKLNKYKHILISYEEYKHIFDLYKEYQRILQSYRPKDRAELKIKQPGKGITEEVFEQLMKVEEYKNTVSFINFGIVTWIIVPKHLCSSVMEYIENLDVCNFVKS